MDITSKIEPLTNTKIWHEPGMSYNFNVNIGRFRDICQEEGILSLLMPHVVFTSCNTTKIVAKTSFLANITAAFACMSTLALYLPVNFYFGTAFAAPTLALHLQRQSWGHGHRVKG